MAADVLGWGITSISTSRLLACRRCMGLRGCPSRLLSCLSYVSQHLSSFAPQSSCTECARCVSWPGLLWPILCLSFQIQECKSPVVGASSRKQGLPDASHLKGCDMILVLMLLSVITGAHADLLEPLTMRVSGSERSDLAVLNNSLIQSYAFKAFRHPKTGTIFNVSLPPDMLDVTVQAVRLRTGSLRRRGFVFNEFSIPTGVVVNETLRSVVLVYRKFEKVSGFNSSLPRGYNSGPVVGILVYDAANLTSTQQLPELSVIATQDRIVVHLDPSFIRSGALCASFSNSSPGSVLQTTDFSGTCSYDHLGDFSVLSLSQQSAVAHSQTSDAWKIAVGSVVGVVVVLLFLGFLALVVHGMLNSAKMTKMQGIADRGETLQTALIGNSRAPAAAASRTRPVLEDDYVA